MALKRLIAQLDAALQQAASPALAQSLQRYFPEPVQALGVANAAVAEIARQVWADNPGIPSEDWLALAGHFGSAHAWHEQLILASALAARLARGPDDQGRLLAVIKGWLEADVSNWAQCDDLCIKPLYIYLKRNPALMADLPAWGESHNPWCRRASNVALVKFVGRHDAVDLAAVLANCGRLLADPDPYVQKGIGWMLKVASQRQTKEVLAFLREHRTAIDAATMRYAIEKLDPATRREFARR